MTGFNQEVYHRKSIRLRGYDYTQKGAYFITICTKARELYFELYPELKHIVQFEWESLPERFPHIVLDTFVIMPNHIHAIVIIVITPALPGVDVEATLAVARNRAGTSPAPTLGNIIGAFKSVCMNVWLKHIKQNNMDVMGSIWQRNYYEHIIRSEKELNLIREYIVNNPLKWSFDRENPGRIADPRYSAEWNWLEGKE